MAHVQQYKSSKDGIRAGSNSRAGSAAEKTANFSSGYKQFGLSAPEIALGPQSSWRFAPDEDAKLNQYPVAGLPIEFQRIPPRSP
jgi:hypothetical protein